MHYPSFMILKPISIVSGSEVFIAAYKGDLKELKTLLNDKEEKNPVLVEEDGSTVIHLAAILGHLDIIKWYKEELNCSNINPKNNKGNTPLSQAIRLENLDVVEFYMDCGYSGPGNFPKKFVSQCVMSRLVQSSTIKHLITLAKSAVGH